MKRFFAVLVSVISIGVFAQTQIRDLVVPLDAYGRRAFDAQSDQIARNRQVVVKELVEFGDRAAQAGIAYSADEWRKLANELAGGFLSSAIPTEDTLRMTLRVQNAQAEKTRQRNAKGLEVDNSKDDSLHYWKTILTADARSKGQVTLYVDPASRQRMGNVATIWSLENYSEVMENQGLKYFSVVQFSESDCANNKIRLLELAVYSNQMGKGQVVHSSDKPKSWLSASGNRSAAIYKAACWGG